MPDGELGEDDIACTVVFYPDRTEYRAALQGSLAYLATWIAWEKDSQKRGKDAAENWRETYELTTECWRMGCFEQLTEDVTNILLLLQNKKDCCDDNLTYGPPTEHETDIDPGVGDPPDYYGETAISDWEEWEEHVCFNAHAWVDELIRQAETISTALSVGGIVIGLVAAALALLAYVATGGFIYAPSVMLIARALIAGATDTMFDQAAEDIGDNRAEIICALLQGGSVSDAVESALSISATWTLFFEHVDYDTATAIIHEGGRGEVYLPADKKFDCVDCAYPLLTDQDVVVNITLGSFIDYDEVTKVWTVRSQSWSSCHHIDIMFWTDMSMTVRMPVLIEVLTCEGTGDCSGIANHRGFLYPGPTLEWSLVEPNLPDTDQSEIEYYVSLHWPVQYDITFRLYDPS